MTDIDTNDSSDEKNSAECVNKTRVQNEREPEIDHTETYRGHHIRVRPYERFKGDRRAVLSVHKWSPHRNTLLPEMDAFVDRSAIETWETVVSDEVELADAIENVKDWIDERKESKSDAASMVGGAFERAGMSEDTDAS